jgi:hypothetical protein
MSARERVLARVREAIAHRERTEHPGDFEAWRPAPYDGRVGPGAPAVEGFAAMLEARGRRGGPPARHGPPRPRWLADFASGSRSDVLGATVPSELRPALPEARP